MKKGRKGWTERQTKEGAEGEADEKRGSWKGIGRE